MRCSTVFFIVRFSVLRAEQVLNFIYWPVAFYFAQLCEYRMLNTELYSLSAYLAVKKLNYNKTGNVNIQIKYTNIQMKFMCIFETVVAVEED